MPGPGRSKGCYRCRGKKIKCGQEQPECRKCLSLGIKCPGYRPDNEIVFCDMNELVEERIAYGPPRRKKRTPQNVEADSAVRPQGGGSESEKGGKEEEDKERNWEIVKKENRLPTKHELSTDWKEQALCRLFADYVIETDDVSVTPGFLDKLPLLYGKSGHRNSVLAQAVTSVSLSNFGNQVGSIELLIQARKAYGTGLAMLHKALVKGGEEMTSDGVLGGVLMLNMYEMFSGDVPLQKSIWETHGDALGTLLRIRGTTEQFTSKESGGISRGAHRVIMFKNLLKRTTPGPETDLFEASLDRSTPWSQVMIACNRISGLLSTADLVLKEPPSIGPQSQRLLDIISAFQAEDSIFQIWTANNTPTPPSGNPEMEDAARASPNSSYTPPPEASDWVVRQSWNVYRAARILLLGTLYHLVLRTHQHPDLSPFSSSTSLLSTQIFSDLSSMATNISSATAEVLTELSGDGWRLRGAQDGKVIAGYTSVFPLKIALSVKTISPELRKTIVEQLNFLESTLGLGQARTIRASSEYRR